MQLNLRNLVSLKEWQDIQDNFAAITGVSLQTIDSEGNSLTRPSNLPRLCTEVLKESSLQDKICVKCLPTFLGGNAIVDKNLSYACPAVGFGIYNFLVPLNLDEGKVLGYVLVGPVVLVMRKSKEEYRQIINEVGLSLDAFWEALLEIRVVSYQGVKSLLEFIKEISEYTIKLAYQNLLIATRGIGATRDLTQFNRLFEKLLDVAVEISRADLGSIMFLDKARKSLTIHASKGLSEEIVKNTSVKMGDGIAGTAAKEDRSFLIDDDLREDRIKRYLNRADIISSSMVLPLKVKEDVLGVLNLGAFRTSGVRFNTDNMQTMQKLVELTAMVSLQ